MSREAMASTRDAARTDVDARADPRGGTASITDCCDRAASLAEATR
ncbi:hypothetical protein [Janibacter cremeus]|uniref:Uncharacterized protein n=1 Tax=Janibacter cremeus TaxID=1285192 RepID=A0A852VRQ1_9MICO|nr:hypothetical protein [Janibacter cremeus]NYF98906.1 hypothetical protein [Janibacter cremeus]